VNSPELDEALRKIGRNVLVLQQLEAMLKYLIPRSKIEGDHKAIKLNHEKAVNAISQQTMGNLVKRFIETISAQHAPVDNEQDATSPAFQFRFQVKMSKEDLASKKEAWECVVTERNNLIHSMLANFDPSSTESCFNLSKELDRQYELIKSEYEFIRLIIIEFGECSKMAVQEVKNELIRRREAPASDIET
jgi:hypothetical protein